jgi:hypothetical protein
MKFKRRKMFHINISSPSSGLKSKPGRKYEPSAKLKWHYKLETILFIGFSPFINSLHNNPLPTTVFAIHGQKILYCSLPTETCVTIPHPVS